MMCTLTCVGTTGKVKHCWRWSFGDHCETIMQTLARSRLMYADFHSGGAATHRQITLLLLLLRLYLCLRLLLCLVDASASSSLAAIRALLDHVVL